MILVELSYIVCVPLSLFVIAYFMFLYYIVDHTLLYVEKSFVHVRFCASGYFFAQLLQIPFLRIY